MSRAMIAALAGSVVLHLVLLFAIQAAQPAPEPLRPLLAEFKLSPRQSAAAAEPARLEQGPAAPGHHDAPPAVEAAAVVLPQLPPSESETRLQDVVELPPQIDLPKSPESAPPPAPVLPAHGAIRYTVYRGLMQNQEVGRAEHEWRFEQDFYTLRVRTETTGLARLLKPYTIEYESRGRVYSEGLRPERFSARRNGIETSENAVFDWNSRQLYCMAGRFDLTPGAQDFVSFYYQLAYVPRLSEGTTFNVMTGKRYQAYRFDALGEETLETPAGLFRVMHLRVQLDSTIDLWLALDKSMLPVKIRFTDRKGEIFEQIAEAIGTPEE